MSSSKHTRSEPPQISISSWLMGGPIVTRPRHARPPPIPVTTQLAKPCKPAETTNSDDKNVEKGKEQAESQQDANKKVEEAKSDIVIKNNGTEKKDNEWTWTPEQDALLLDLKGKNTSWKDIANKMSLTKSDVRVRFKELNNKGAETRSDDTVETGEDKDDKQGTKIKSEGVQKAVQEDGDSIGGSQGRLRPDDNWSRDDCEILEMLEARYREQKWLSMQASFYNLTGRMVRADIIERKLSEARR